MPTDVEMARAGVLADPDDVLARYAFADACEEAGLLRRAEFVRLQMEHYNMAKPMTRISTRGNSGCVDCVAVGRGQFKCKFHMLQDRLDTMLADYNNWLEYTADLPLRPSQANGVSVQFNRGFVELVRCDMTDWLLKGPTMVEVTPVQFVITDRTWECTRNSRRPIFVRGYNNRIQHSLPNKIYDLVYQELRKSPHDWSKLSGNSYQEAVWQIISKACVQWAKEKRT